MADPKAQLKAANKEGGKKGVDVAGMSDMGGVKFFNVVVETPEGDPKLMDAVLEGMNAEVDEAAEERRGGAGHLGKLLLSAGDKQLVLACHVPKALADSHSVNPESWVDKLVAAAGGEVVSRETIIKVVIKGNPDAGHFPLKMRDAAQTAGFQFLRENNLIPADDDDDSYIPDPEAAGIEW